MAGRPVVLPWNFATFSGNEPVTTLSDNFSALANIINDSAAGATNYAVDTGTTNNYVVTIVPPPVAYEAGFMIVINPANTNTGASVINANALGNKSILHADGTALTGNEIVAGVAIALVYNGTAFVLANAPLSTVSAPGLQQAPYSGVRLIDECTALPGAYQWNSNNSGAGVTIQAVTTTDAVQKAWGVFQLTIPAGAGFGRASLFSASPIWPGLGACTIDVKAYADTSPSSFGTVYWFGLSDLTNTVSAIEIGLWASVSATNWVGQCMAASTTSSTNGVALVLGTNKLTIQINAAWTSVSFFANGTLIGSPLATNIPTGVLLYPFMWVTKVLTSGAAINAYVDVYDMDYRYSR
jgi:hypothetical protein